MRSRVFLRLLVLLVPVATAMAGTTGQTGFDASRLSAAFPESRVADDAAIVAEIRRRLPPGTSVSVDGRFVVAAPGSMQATADKARRIAGYDAQIRRRYFPNLEPPRILVVLGDDIPALQRLAAILYPEIAVSDLPPAGFYHSGDRLILALDTDGDSAILDALMRALVRDDNPDAPQWFEEAMATLYESSDSRAGRLVPVLNARMDLIAPDEDLTYDVFAGICDCSALTGQQLALIRLLLVYLYEHDRLTELNAAVREQGPYTTLLQALDAMAFDREGWKAFAEGRVHIYRENRGQIS